MANTTVVLNTRDLVKFYPSFGTIEPGWSQQVTVTYTPDRNDPLWAGTTEAAGGTVTNSQRDDKTRSLSADVLINVEGMKDETASLSVVMHPTLDGRTTTEYKVTKPTLNDLRQGGIRLLSHELLHVIQEWVVPGGYAARNRDATLKVVGKDPCLLFHPEDRARAAYQENDYEKAAYQRSEEFVSKNRAAIKGGSFDDYLPISMMTPLTQ